VYVTAPCTALLIVSESNGYVQSATWNRSGDKVISKLIRQHAATGESADNTLTSSKLRE